MEINATPAENAAATPTSEERTLAALAHASSLLNFVIGGVGGVIGALLIWATQKDKSAWVGFHALQSLVFQGAQVGLFFLVVVVPWILGFVFSFVTLGFGTLIAVPIMILLMFVGLAIMFGGMAYSLYGAYQVYDGGEFRYKWVADWLERRQGGGVKSGAVVAGEARAASGAKANVGRLIMLVVGGLLAVCAVVALCSFLFITIGPDLGVTLLRVKT